jgi:hypothetical protein
MVDMKKLNYTQYGLSIYEIDGEEYAIAADEGQAHAAAKEYIQDSLWSFSAEFILNHNSKITVTRRLINVVVKVQQELCEDCNELFLGLIDDLDEFVDNAINSDGLGHFLAICDGEINDIYVFEQEVIDYITILEKLEVERMNEVLVFRIN